MGDEQETLSQIYFGLKKGQTLGIVGPTGAGKATLLKLLLRERDVESRYIALDGHDIRNYRLADLRSLMGYVPWTRFSLRCRLRTISALQIPTYLMR